MTKKKEEELQKTNLIKVVFFDENSALEYLDIKNEGRYIFNEEEIKKRKNDLKNNNDVKFGIGGKASEILKYIGIDAKASTEVSMGLSRSNHRLFNSSISNTILTDFLKSVDEYEDEIATFVGFDFKIIDNSFAYIKTIAPILKLLKDGYTDKVDEFKDIDIKEIENVLEKSKGYFEFLVVKGEEKALLRLNTNELKNNYKFGDLQDMNLVFYGIKVGKLSKDMLKIENYFERLDNKKSIDTKNSKEENKLVSEFENFLEGNKNPQEIDTNLTVEEDFIDLYDIILAGINNE